MSVCGREGGRRRRVCFDRIVFNHRCPTFPKHSGRGAVTAVAAAGDVVIVATARGYLLRYDVAGGGAPTEVELSRAPDAVADGVWLDPSGTHTVAAVTVGGRHEMHYVHARWKRSRPLAVATASDAVAVAAFDSTTTTDTSTGDVLLGTDAGDVLIVTFDERDKRERGGARAYTLRGSDGARAQVTGAALARAHGGHRVALVATPDRLHVFVGSGPGVGLAAVFVGSGPGVGLAAVFAGYPADGADLKNGWLPTASDAAAPPLDGAGALAANPSPGGGLDVTWLCPAGLATARLPADAGVAPPADALPGHDASLLTDTTVAPLPRGALGPASPPAVRAMAATRHHALIVDGGRVLAFNRVSGGLVQALTPRSATRSSSGAPAPLLPRRALAADPSSGALYVTGADTLLEATAADEGRDMWRVFVARGDYAAAALAATTRAARDAVALAEADAAFEAGDRGRAAVLYGRALTSDPPFEEVALKFVDSRDTDALASLLSARVAALPRRDRAQAAALAAWLLELKLDAVNRAALGEASGGGGDGATAAADAAVRSTLEHHADALDVGVAVGLLAAYGRADDLLHYARLRGDAEAVLEHLTAALAGGGGQHRGSDADPAATAAAALRAAAAAPDLAVRFAPALFDAAPAAAVDAWLAADPPLDAKRLVPALARARARDAPPAARAAALRYCRAAAVAGAGDAALHNLAVALLAEEAGAKVKAAAAASDTTPSDASDGDASSPEADLLAYLRSARDPSTGDPLYDPGLALADASAAGCRRAVVSLLASSGAPEDAVDAALAFDARLAARVAAAPDADADTRRRLALAVVRHAVAAAPDPPAAVDAVDAFLRSDAGACLRLEDVLPLFPAATTVGAFRAAVVRTLDAADARAASLRAAAAAAAAAADAARADLASLERRAGRVGAGEPCAACGRPVGGAPPAAAGPAGGRLPPVYLFPTGAAYHGACAASTAAASLPPREAAAWRARVASVAAGGGGDAAAAAALDADLGSEDPACGERAVRALDVPLLDGVADAVEVEAWRVAV